MKNLLPIILSFLLPLAGYGQTVFTAKLSGSQEVPAIASPATGSIEATLTGNELVVTGSFSELTGKFNVNIAGGSHVHQALAGSNGGIEFNIIPTITETDSLSGTFEAANNTITLDADQLQALNDRRLYVNIHTTTFPGGELRGQLIPEADQQFQAVLFGSNEVPTVMSMGTGGVLLELNGDSLFVSGSFNGLESPFNNGIGAHLHLGYAGQNGGVEIPLKPAIIADTSGIFPIDSNRFELTTEQKGALLRNQLYVNIHSTDIPSGELRGQVHPLANAVFRAFLAGSNEAPPVLSTANGQLLITLDGDSLNASGAFANFSSPFNPAIGMTGAHLHRGLAGQNGGIEFLLNPQLEAGNLAGTFLPADNGFTLTNGQIDTLFARGYYANLHSEGNPSGEARGQVVPQSNFFFNAPLGGAQERPSPVNTAGSGNVIAEFLGNQLTVTGSFNSLTGDFDETIGMTGAHIHLAPAGRNGGISVLLNVNEAADQKGGLLEVANNVSTLRGGQLDSLRQRLGYVNIHTTEVPAGEIRGQLLREATAFFSVQAAGTNEVPSVDTTTGIGGLVGELNGDRLLLSGSFENLIGKFNPNIAGGSHVHLGPAGTNGPIAFGLNATITEMDSLSGQYAAADNGFTLSGDTLQALFDGGLYFNLHTEAVASGEIRGQLLPMINLFPDSARITSPASGAAITIEGEATTPFVAEWSEETEPNGNPLAYVWQLSAAEDFSALIVSADRADTASFTTDFGTVAALLQSAGLQEGESITLYHRAIASDGSLRIIGPADSVSLTLGDLVTNTRELWSDQFDMTLFPNPATDRISLDINANEGGRANWQLFDLRGRLLQRERFDLQRGKNRQVLSVQELPMGTYFLQLMIDGRPLPARRILIKR